MARQLTTRAQVNGYRFLLSRLEHALVRRDVRMLHDPMRSQSRALVVGAVLAVVLVAGCGIWGLVRPQGSVGGSVIVMSKASGALYVLIAQPTSANSGRPTLHPVLNLASARLIMNTDAAPTSVSDAKLASYPRGPLLGIPGAPTGLPGSARSGASVWTVCEETDQLSGSRSLRLTVIVGALTTATASGPSRDAVFVTDGSGSYLIYLVAHDDGFHPVRARVDTDDPAVMRAFGLDATPVRPIGPGLLNTVPEVDELAVPQIPGVGGRGVVSAEGVRVGSVVKTVGVNDVASYFVVLRSALQQITEPTAEMLRLAEATGATTVTALPPAAIVGIPRTRELPVTDFPASVPRLRSAAAVPAVCVAWSKSAGDARARSEMLMGSGLPLAPGDRPVRLTSADGAGSGIDQVYLRPGSGEYLQVTGNDPGSPRSESLFYLTDSGIRFGIPDLATGRVLGLGTAPSPAPWAVVSLLTAGATLSRGNALVAHDAIGADPIAGPVAGPPS